MPSPFQAGAIVCGWVKPQSGRLYVARYSGSGSPKVMWSRLPPHALEIQKAPA